MDQLLCRVAAQQAEGSSRTSRLVRTRIRRPESRGAKLRGAVSSARRPKLLSVCHVRGDPYNSEKAGASCWSPRTWHTDSKFGLSAGDTAPRSFAPCDSGRSIRVRTRREVRLEPSACCAATLQRSRSKPQHQTCSLCAKPACCDFARLALRISQHRSANSKRMPRYLSAFFLVLLASLEICPRAGILESYWNKDGIIHGMLA